MKQQWGSAFLVCLFHPLWPFVFLRIPQAECFSQSLVLRFFGLESLESDLLQAPVRTPPPPPKAFRMSGNGHLQLQEVSLTMRGSAASMKKDPRKNQREVLAMNIGKPFGTNIGSLGASFQSPGCASHHLIDGLDPSYTFRCCTFRCFTILWWHLWGRNIFSIPQKMEFDEFEVGKSWKIIQYTFWLFNIAMENGPFLVDLPIKHVDFPWLC